MTIQAVILDSREPTWVQQLRFGSASVMVQALPAGDACIATPSAVILVERKTAADLLASIADDRLFTQIGEMRKQTPWVYVVVTGDMVKSGASVVAEGRRTQWTWASLQGALITAQELGATIVYCASDADYADTLTAIAAHPRGSVRVEPQREVTMMSPGELLLTSLPGISEVRARALLDYCGSAGYALVFLTEGGDGQVPEKVPGIGAATKQAARAALGLPDDILLEITTRPDEN